MEEVLRKLETHDKKFQEHEKNFHRLEVTLTKIKGDTAHLKTRIDNGLSVTINKVLSKMEEFIPLIQRNTIVSDKVDPLIPDVKENTRICDDVRWAFRFITVVGILGGMVALAFYLIRTVV